MIKLATVFSGIGAIEHALDRMGLQHQIVFACDNGDVDILNKEIAVNIDDVGTELKHLKRAISAIGLDNEVEDLYKMQLVGMLHEALAEYEVTYKSIQDIPVHESMLSDTLSAIVAMPDLKAARKKEYIKFSSELHTAVSILEGKNLLEPDVEIQDLIPLNFALVLVACDQLSQTGIDLSCRQQLTIPGPRCNRPVLTRPNLITVSIYRAGHQNLVELPDKLLSKGLHHMVNDIVDTVDMVQYLDHI